MSKIVVFGAGGKAVAEAVCRGHEVIAVMRDPGKYPDLGGAGVSVVAGDVTDADSVATVAAGADAAVSAVFRPDVPAGDFYRAAAEALVGGLAKAGVGRLAVVGVGTALEVSPGVAVHDTPGFPDAGKDFSLGHAAEIAVLEGSDASLDYVIVVPPPVVLDADAERTGKYTVGGRQLQPTVEGAPAFAYADLAVALIDEVETPRHHRELISVA
ncbi:NAD(P)-dependent oxidoreductase [Actinoplanes sp. TFC3]|uniref:NAD(P)-dependent oxidoreductase n=1 Tax=Actinoplanes sp. TFC3 TaxID=1710355 RepID=UPI00082A7DF6|nr:NAD(P)H-binding protein [Actinoplanes sp. TFC3]